LIKIKETTKIKPMHLGFKREKQRKQHILHKKCLYPENGVSRLPWSDKDSRGPLHRPYGTTGTSEHNTPARLPSDCPIQFDEAETIKATLVDCNTAGSMFSIHSAPPVPLADLGNLQSANSLLEFDVIGKDSPRRPASLAIDNNSMHYHSSKTIAAFQHQHSEIEEDDNENLLTVSSLTARPLIAKSRELRSSKLAERFKRKKRIPADPLDGGYGWFVVLGAFFVQFWVAGLVKSYGVLFVEILETFPTKSTAVVSWIPAILSALCLALAPLSSALCQRFSCRSVVFVGGLFCTFGLTLSYFATSLYHLLFTFGILTGIGGGLSTTPGIIIVSMYFDKHRALANGICVSGTAAGSFVFPALIRHLVQNYGFHGTILILGGCMLHVCACAALYRPLETISDVSITSKSPDNASRIV
ncbi:Monocarboxylate transporter 12, partial [Pseudolycoriella hygida]